MDDIIERDDIELENKQEAIIVYQDDPEQQLAMMEKRAKVAAELTRKQNAVLVAATDPNDWVKFGDQMRLSSVGAEKLARNFGIKLSNWNRDREEFRDKHGPGYTYIYTCDAELAGRKLHAQGICSTRDKFLCKAQGKWKPLEEISQHNIMQAAYHRCQGNAIKALLGIRSLHYDSWKELFEASGTKAEANKEAEFKSAKRPAGKPAKSSGSNKATVELGTKLMRLAKEGKTVEVADDGTKAVVTLEAGSDKERAQFGLKSLTSFINDEGSFVEGRNSLSDLSDKQAFYANKELDKLMKGDVDGEPEFQFT